MNKNDQNKNTKTVENSPLLKTPSQLAIERLKIAVEDFFNNKHKYNNYRNLYETRRKERTNDRPITG